jgi:hypothetical protein
MALLVAQYGNEQAVKVGGTSQPTQSNGNSAFHFPMQIFHEVIKNVSTAEDNYGD